MSRISLLNQGRSCLLPNRPRHPWVLVGGEGCYAWDDDGRRYLDFASGATGNLLGHGHPRLVRALGEQGRGMLAAPARGYHLSQIDLAALLADLSFADRALFCRDSKEARAAAVALAAEHRRLRDEERDEIIVPVPEGVEEPVGITVPGVRLRYTRYGDVAAVAEIIGHRTSAVLAAPLAMAGGVILPQPRYIEEMRALCDAARALLVVDASRVPIGRTGSLFGYEHERVRPDMLLVAHSLSAGEPFGVVLLREELSRGAGRSLLGFNVGGAPVQCALAVETIRALTEDGLLDSCARVGRYLGNQLDLLRRRSPLIRAVRGTGLLFSVDLATGADAIALGCQQRGVLLAQAGRATLLVQPPLTIQRAHVRAFISAFREVLADEGGVHALPDGEVDGADEDEDE